MSLRNIPHKVLLSTNLLYRRILHLLKVTNEVQQAQEKLGNSVLDETNQIHVIASQIKKSIDDQNERILQIQQRQEDIEKNIGVVGSSVNLSIRSASVDAHKTIKCLFIIHNIEVWSALKGIYELMLYDPNFEPIVASCNRRYPSGRDYINEHIVHEGLKELDVPHIRLTHADSFIDLELIKTLSPNIIFRQSVWENDVPPAFGTKYLTFARLYSVPYFTLPMTEDPASYLDFDYSRAATNFVINDTIKEEYDKHSQGTVRVIATGHPKIDELLAAKPVWSISSKNTTKILWVAHHAIFDDWINFGLLPKIYRSMYTIALSHPKIDFLFSPHPGIYGALERLDRENPLLSDKLRKFFNQWDELPNTGTIRHGGGVGAMKASDMMIIDGASMLVDYQALDKPIIFLERKDHAKFNQFGDMMAKGADVLHVFTRKSIEDAILRITREIDTARAKRGKNREFIMQYPNSASNIVEVIKQDFAL